MEEDYYVKKTVSEIVENNKEFIAADRSNNPFKKIVPALVTKSLEDLDLSMFSPETRACLLEALGDEYVRRGNLPNAVKAFLIAQLPDKIVSVGQSYEILQEHDKAIEAYRLANDMGRLRSLADRCLADGRFDSARKAYTMLGDKDKLRHVGEICLQRGKWDTALEVFNELDDKEWIIKVGELCVKELEYKLAEKAFEMAKDPQLLSTLGDICLKQGHIGQAFNCYGKAGNNVMVEFIKMNFANR